MQIELQYISLSSFVFWSLHQTNNSSFLPVPQKILLTLCGTIPTCYDPKKESFWKLCGKWRKCWLPAFSPFSTIFSILKTNFIFWCCIYFVLCKCFEFWLVLEILSFGKQWKAFAKWEILLINIFSYSHPQFYEGFF